MIGPYLVTRDEIGGKIHGHRSRLPGRGADQLAGEAGNERVGRHVQPEVLLLGQAASRRGNLGDRPSVTGAGVIDHHKVAILHRARHVDVGRAPVPQDTQRPLEILFAHDRNLAFDG